MGIGYGGDQVGRTRSTRGHADTHSARCGCISLSRMPGALLIDMKPDAR